MALKTISSFVLNPAWRYGGTTAKLRLYYSESFVDNEQRPVVGGAVGSSGFYGEANITIANNVATVAAFDLITTEDSDHPNTKVTGALYDEGGAYRENLFEWSVPSNTILSSPSTIALMEAYNTRNSIINPPQFYMTQAQIVALLTAMLATLGVVDASSTVKGITKLSINPAVASNPVAWGINDPLVRDALKLTGIELDASLAAPANTNVIGFNAALGKFVAQATAVASLHALSHQDGGTDEISVAGLSGQLTDPQTPLTHAASHQNGGSDEISVAGLSGLLADAQTALAHNTSHQSGGSDAIKLDDLAVPDDNTDLNATAAAHGLLPKLSNNPSEFLNGQGAFIAPSGAGDVVGPSSSIDGEFALFDSTTGKLLKRATGSGFVKATSGVYSTEANPTAGLPFELCIACSDETTALTTGTAKVTFRMPRGVTLTAVRASLTTPQTSGSIFTVDINEGGTTILSTKITIDNGEKTSTTAVTAPVISDSALADDAEMTIDIDQIGDGTAKGLKVYLIGVRA